MMRPTFYMHFSGGLFLVVGLLHLFRAASAWPIAFGPWDIPLWWSWVLGGTALVLAFAGLTFGTKASAKSSAKKKKRS